MLVADRAPTLSPTMQDRMQPKGCACLGGFTVTDHCAELDAAANAGSCELGCGLGTPSLLEATDAAIEPRPTYDVNLTWQAVISG